MAYQHKSQGVMWNLHSMVVRLKGSGVHQRIYWFSTKAGKNAIDELPKGYKVVTSRKTGLPFLKKG